MLADPDKDGLSRRVYRLVFLEGTKAGQSLLSAALLAILALLSWSFILSRHSPFILEIIFTALVLLTTLLLLFTALNFYVARSYTDADKGKIDIYKCRRCGYRWEGLDPPHEPYINRLRWEVARSRKGRNRRYLATLLSALGSMELINGADPAEATTYLEEALALGRQLGDKKISSYTLNSLAFALYIMGRLGEAREYIEESLTIFHEQKEWRGVANALDTLGYIKLD